MGDQLYYGPRSRFVALQNGHEPSFDFEAAIQEKKEIVTALRHSNYSNVLEALDGVDFLEAQARFTSLTTIEANGETYEGDKVVIATGASAKPLAVDGFDKVKWHTNRTIMDLEKAPESLLVIGGGPEGLEFAQMFGHFGTMVTVLVAKGHRVLRREEPEIVNEIVRSLEGEGIQFLARIHRRTPMDGVRTAEGGG